MEAYPYLVSSDSSGEKLELLLSKEKTYNESWLQEILRKQPEILPVAEIEPIYYPLVSIGKEVPTETGIIDNLFISKRGYLVLVETKLWRNPESKREVVAQAFDYGLSLSKWNYEKLNAAVRDYTKRIEKAELDLFDWVEKKLGPIEGGKIYFENTVFKNLRLGRFLTLIVGDKIRQSVFEMVKDVNKFPGLAMAVALMELQCFRVKTNKDWPIFIVPRVVSKSEIVERSIVQVTVTQGEPPKIEVKQEKEEPSGEKTKKKVTLTEEAFWELLKEKSFESYETARKLIEEYIAMDGIDVIPTESAMLVKLDIQDTGKQLSLFLLPGRLN